MRFVLLTLTLLFAALAPAASRAEIGYELLALSIKPDDVPRVIAAIDDLMEAVSTS